MENQEPSHAELLKSRWNDFRSRYHTSYPGFQPDGTLDFELRKEFKAKEEERERKFKNHEMSKEEVLHHLRGIREKQHRERIQHGFEYYAFCWNSKPIQRPCLDKLARFWRAGTIDYPLPYERDFVELSNKSVPLYVLTSSRLGDLEHSISKVHACLQKTLCCYLYNKWFRPYKSDIDFFNQFIAKIIVPMDLECRERRPPAALVDDIVEINKEIVSYINTAKEDILKEIQRRVAVRKNQRPQAEFANHSWQDPKLDAFSRAVLDYHPVPALFKSLGVILCTEAWGRTGPFEIGNTPVCMFLIGVEDSGLSAPITFDSIEDKVQAVLQRVPKKAVQTTLDTAVDFIMELERREASAAAARSPSHRIFRTVYPKPEFPEAYNHFFEGVTVWGPSSEWIDAKAYQKWSGPGAEADLDTLNTCMEEHQRMVWKRIGGAR